MKSSHDSRNSAQSDSPTASFVRDGHDSDYWLRQLPASPFDQLSEANASALTAMRRQPVRMISRTVAGLQQSIAALVQEYDRRASDSIDGFVAELSKRLETAVRRRLSQDRLTGLCQTIENQRQCIERVRQSLDSATGALHAEFEAERNAASSRRAMCARQSQRWSSFLTPWRCRRSARRAIEATVTAGGQALRHARHHQAGCLIDRVSSVLDGHLQRLRHVDARLRSELQSSENFLNDADRNTHRLPGLNVAPPTERVREIADHDLFPNEALQELAARAAGDWMTDADLEDLLEQVVNRTVSSTPLPRTVTAYLESLNEDRRTALLNLLNSQAAEAAVPNVLAAPGGRRWRLRLLHLPGGLHNPFAGALRQLSADVHTRVVDNGDPDTIGISTEEHALAACQLEEIRRAEDISRRATSQQRAAAATCFDVDDLDEIPPALDGDPEAAEALLLKALALGVIRRDRGNGYRTDAPGIAEAFGARIAQGYAATLDRLGRDAALRYAIERELHGHSTQLGEARVQQALEQLQGRLRQTVPADAVRRAEDILQQRLNRSGYPSRNGDVPLDDTAGGNGSPHPGPSYRDADMQVRMHH